MLPQDARILEAWKSYELVGVSKNTVQVGPVAHTRTVMRLQGEILCKLERMQDNNVYLKSLTKEQFRDLAKDLLKILSERTLGEVTRTADSLCSKEEHDFAWSNCQRATEKTIEYLIGHDG